MTLTPLEALGIASFFGFVTSAATKVWCEYNSKDCVTHSELEALEMDLVKRCDDNRAHCPGTSITLELREIKALLSVMCERLDISVRDRQQIEKDAR